MDRKEVIKQFAAGVLGAASLFVGVYALKSNTAERFFDYLSKEAQKTENRLLKEGNKFVKYTVKPGDTVDKITLKCYGRPSDFRGNETVKLEARTAVVRLNGLGKYIYPGQELYVPFNEETAGDLEACLERSSGVYTLHKDPEGRHYFVLK